MTVICRELGYVFGWLGDRLMGWYAEPSAGWGVGLGSDVRVALGRACWRWEVWWRRVAAARERQAWGGSAWLPSRPVPLDLDF